MSTLTVDPISVANVPQCDGCGVAGVAIGGGSWKCPACGKTGNIPNITEGVDFTEDAVMSWKCVPADQIKGKINPPTSIPQGQEVVWSNQGTANALRITDVVGNLKRLAMDYEVELETTRDAHLLWQTVYWKVKSTEEYRVRAFTAGMDAWVNQFNGMFRKG